MADKRNDRLFMHISDIGISEQDIWDYEPDILKKLLLDHTMSEKARKEAGDHTKTANIFWATSNYESSVFDEKSQLISEGYKYNNEIKAENLIGRKTRIVMPRVLKSKLAQQERTKDKAEVFTPSWVCNAQNNLIDDAWFGYSEAFNKEIVTEEGLHSWVTNENKIQFPDPKKDWKEYVKDIRLEITCGEAPYLVSRYDTTTGEPISLRNRIGLLDRKMRVVNENVETEAEWYKMAEKAFKSTYGYEWQGDNLLLARESLLYTYIEYFIDRFNEKNAEGNYITDNKGKLKVPTKNKILNAASWISWNLWQMDGIKMVVPDSCHKINVCINQKDIENAIKKNEEYESSLFPTESEPIPEPIYELKECPGCASGDHKKHTGRSCLIREWGKAKPKDWKPSPGEDPKSRPWEKIKFRSLVLK